MSRRTAERHARRIEVRFWRRGQTQAHSGFTVDLSKTGMFLGTSMSFEPGERLRLEIVDRDKGFMIEGQVARVHRVSLALRHIEQPGVGVRFLGPGELVGQLLHSGRSAGAREPSAGASTPEPRERPSAPAPTPNPAASPAAPAPPAPPPAKPSPRPAKDSLEDLFGPDPDSAKAPAAPAAEPAPVPAASEPLAVAAAPAAPAASAARSVPVEFADRDGFLAVYQRDIAAGGLFVTTDAPAELHEVVVVELRPPIHADRNYRFEARVVHRFDGKGGSVKPGLVGMGVQFLDPDRVREQLSSLVAELRG